MSKTRYSIKMLIGSILAGLAYGQIGEFFYQCMERSISHILVSMLYFSGMYLFLGLAVYVIGRAGSYQSYGPVNRRQWAAAFVLMLLLSAFFEFLYGWVGTGGKQPVSSYLFVIDNSGSMDKTDPDGMRYQAIEKLLENKEPEFLYGIYHFSDSAKLVRDMAPVRAGGYSQEAVNGGGTAVIRALDTILSDIHDGRLVLDDHCRMILLSDGYATDVDDASRYDCIRRLEQFADQGISISTVGMAGDVDTQLLMLAADKTGGTYVSVQHVEQLEQGMRLAAQTEEENRNLLGYRSESTSGILYAAMRIIFIICLGILVAVEKTVLCERFLNTNSVLASSMIGSGLAGICLEAGMNTFGLHPSAMRTALCVLIAFTLLHEDEAVEDERTHLL